MTDIQSNSTDTGNGTGNGNGLSSVVPQPEAGIENKSEQVQSMFDRIAKRYDVLNDCISFGMHRGWKKTACKQLHLNAGDSVLDVCSGTGDLIGYLNQHVGNTGHITALDFSADMLAVAKERFADLSNLKVVQGDALALPFENNTFDSAIVSFGLRNVVDIQQAINEMSRVVKPGGWVVNLDTCPEVKLPGFWLYFSTIMPIMGKLLALDKKAYSYLSKSTKHFLTPEQLGQCFTNAGLQNVTLTPLSFHSVSIQAGQIHQTKQV